MVSEAIAKVLGKAEAAIGGGEMRRRVEGGRKPKSKYLKRPQTNPAQFYNHKMARPVASRIYCEQDAPFLFCNPDGIRVQGRVHSCRLPGHHGPFCAKWLATDKSIYLSRKII